MFDNINARLEDQFQHRTEFVSLARSKEHAEPCAHQTVAEEIARSLQNFKRVINILEILIDFFYFFKRISIRLCITGEGVERLHPRSRQNITNAGKG
jgi:hypothetical protein